MFETPFKFDVSNVNESCFRFYYFVSLCDYYRYQLQEDLLDKDHTVESLQRKLTSLQGEMRMIVKENNLLNDKLDKAQVRVSIY